MQVSYQEIDSGLIEMIAVKYGEMAKNHFHTESGSCSIIFCKMEFPGIVNKIPHYCK